MVPWGDLRRAREQADAEWTAQSATLAADLLAIADPAARAARYAGLVAHLAKTGDALLPADDERVRESFRRAGQGSAPEAGPGAAQPPLEPTPEDLEYQREYAAWRIAAEARWAAQDARALRNRRIMGVSWGAVSLVLGLAGPYLLNPPWWVPLGALLGNPLLGLAPFGCALAIVLCAREAALAEHADQAMGWCATTAAVGFGLPAVARWVLV